MPDGFIPQHGGYQRLLGYRKAEIIYDATVIFCNRFLHRGDRTIDQMTQAARSGKQNIAEGSMASATSKKTEIKLTNVARTSLEELLIDYTDYLRINELSLWDKNCDKAKFIRNLGRKSDECFESYKIYIETKNDETVANIIICLIHQASFLLYQQITKLESDFLKNGGITEKMYAKRTNIKKRSLNNNSE
jgi:four helix bundle suffix protein